MLTLPEPTLTQSTNPAAELPVRRVLIAEDNPDLRSIFRSIFVHCKFEVALAENGIEALERLAENCPDVLVLDINMPYLNGLGVLSHIRQTPTLRRLKVIVVTGNAVAVGHPDAQQADLLLVKPVNINELIVMAQRLIST